MRKTTILIGPPGSGKTYRAKEMVKDKKHLFLAHYNLFDMSGYLRPYSWVCVEEDTEIIVIDEWTGNIDQLRELIWSDFITVHKPMKKSFERERPELIVITQDDFEKSDFEPRPGLEIIELT